MGWEHLLSYEKIKNESYANLGGINTKASPYITGPTQFLNLVNMDFVAVGSLTKRPGTSLYTGSTIAGAVGGLYEWERLSGSSLVITTANTNAYFVNGGLGGNFVPFKSGLLNEGIFDFSTFVDRLFMCNGQDFFKYNGSNPYNVFLPQGDTGAFGITAVVGGGLSGVFLASYGYLNERGYQGPANFGYTISLNGITFGSIQYYGLTTPAGYGITGIQLYRSNPGLAVMFGTTTISAGSTTFTDTGITLTNLQANFNYFLTLIPRYVELYNNQMFYAGFSTAPSTVWWSQIGEPEGIDVTFNADFRTNDGDRITGLKQYAGTLVVSKQRSFHRIVGDDPSNFSLQELSDHYGCISNRALVAYENYLLFLDQKGVVQYNGANFEVISDPVEPIFRRMNIDAATDGAVGLQDKFRNMVMFAIPIDGATMNNAIVCYDYLVQAWTTYTGINPAVMATVRGGLPFKTTMFGSYSGTISYMGVSLMGDNGNAITCLIQSRFLAELGNSVEKQWRRLFLNCDPTDGASNVMNVSLFKNYDQSTVQVTAAMALSPFQSRIDFGISSKSFSWQGVHSSATLPLRIHGFSVDYRFQRAV